MWIGFRDTGFLVGFSVDVGGRFFVDLVRFSVDVGTDFQGLLVVGFQGILAVGFLGLDVGWFLRVRIV